MLLVGLRWSLACLFGWSLDCAIRSCISSLLGVIFPFSSCVKFLHPLSLYVTLPSLSKPSDFPLGLGSSSP